MGMTIDAQIKALEYLKKCGIFPFSDTRTGIVFTDESIDGAVDTMRKYQKIMNIVMNGDDTHYKLLMQIKEVIKDGNDD